MAALQNLNGYTVIVPDDSVDAYLATGWFFAGSEPAPEPVPKKRVRKSRAQPAT
ncbi:hypothetical protein [Cryobacterium sp. Hh7]|uniref:DUF7302 family protein n=1 Tax=Cryobacterium sp. Hh7 TaxID=1259159 RepID=UPI00141A8426|nr:hypothetical protein [Cryobacterium sp. Hh7]